jgi:hypothetical protein
MKRVIGFLILGAIALAIVVWVVSHGKHDEKPAYTGQDKRAASVTNQMRGPEPISDERLKFIIGPEWRLDWSHMNGPRFRLTEALIRYQDSSNFGQPDKWPDLPADDTNGPPSILTGSRVILTHTPTNVLLLMLNKDVVRREWLRPDAPDWVEVPLTKEDLEYVREMRVIMDNWP